MRPPQCIAYVQATKAHFREIYKKLSFVTLMCMNIHRNWGKAAVIVLVVVVVVVVVVALTVLAVVALVVVVVVVTVVVV
jgi:hypothetical protein